MKTLLLGFYSCWALSNPPALTIEEVQPVRLGGGKGADLIVLMKVRDGFHIQANPASKPQLIATRVDLKSAAGVNVGRPIYPKGKPYRIEGLKTVVDTYDGNFQVRLPLKVDAQAKTGKVELEGKVRFQACDNKVCFPPTEARFKAPVEIGS